jgi:hypothetical protein
MYEPHSHQTDAEVVEETWFDEYDEELEAAAAKVENHPDFQRLASTSESLQKDMADCREGLTEGRPWREVKAKVNAVHTYQRTLSGR